MSDRNQARELMRKYPVLKYQNALRFVVEAKDDARRVKQANPEKKFKECILEVASTFVETSKFGSNT